MNRLRLRRRMCWAAAAMMALLSGPNVAVAWPLVPLAQSKPEGQQPGTPNTRQDSPAEKAEGLPRRAANLHGPSHRGCDVVAGGRVAVPRDPYR